MRRTRFTVFTRRPGSEEIVKQVVLAYGTECARNYYTGRGWTVLGVERGDYRKQIKAEGGYRIDRAALRDAIDLLGIKLPVKIRFNSRVGNTAGNYRFRNGGHDIMLKSYHTAEQASSTLWHELTHAMQAERAGGTTETWASFHREQARYSYRNRPVEIEARQMSETMKDVPLCR